MTLSDCTKSELLFVIDYLTRCLLSSGEYHVMMALNDIQSRRDETKYAKARELIELSSRKQKEYFDLVEPYRGQPISDIPASILTEAGNILAEAEDADRRWMKLMDIKVEPMAKDGDGNA